MILHPWRGRQAGAVEVVLGDDEVELGQAVVGQVVQPSQVGVAAEGHVGEALVEGVSLLGISLQQTYLLLLLLLR